MRKSKFDDFLFYNVRENCLFLARRDYAIDREWFWFWYSEGLCNARKMPSPFEDEDFVLLDRFPERSIV